jgi:hypothetical protein
MNANDLEEAPYSHLLSYERPTTKIRRLPFRTENASRVCGGCFKKTMGEGLLDLLNL